LGSVWALSSVPSTLLRTSPNLQQPSYAEVVSIKKTNLPASTGLEDKLAKLSTNTDETAENLKVISIREDQQEVVARTGKDSQPNPKAAAKEKRKRKRKAAKAAVAAAKAKSVIVANVIIDNDVPITNDNTVVEEKAVAEVNTFMLVGPRQGRSVQKSSSLRQKTP
jgi:hypothetical protein